MKHFTWFAYVLMCSLILVACNASQPPPPVDYRTKSPFEPPNRTQTAAFEHTATAEALATQAMRTEQAQATLNVQSTPRPPLSGR
jgi:hypothetical protein